MPGLVNPGGSPVATDQASAAHVGALKDVVRGAAGLAADAAVLVQQLACREPGCPPTETVVAALGPPRLSWKFAKPTAEVSPAELRAAIVEHPNGRTHDDHD